MKKITLFIATFIAITLNFSSCITYQHIMDAEALTATNKFLDLSLYEFKGTYSIGSFSTSNLSEDNEKEFSLKKPTYRSILLKVRKVFGENATFSNVVWDIQKTNVVGIKSERFESVIFDVYVPKK
jgi:hypothetical protein